MLISRFEALVCLARCLGKTTSCLLREARMQIILPLGCRKIIQFLSCQQYFVIFEIIFRRHRAGSWLVLQSLKSHCTLKIVQAINPQRAKCFLSRVKRQRFPWVHCWFFFSSVVVFLLHRDVNVYCLLQTAFDHIGTEFIVENKVHCRLWPAETVMST